MRAFSRLCDRIVNALGAAGSAAIIFIAILSVIEIFRRYVLNAPSIWATDVVIAIAAATYVLAGPYAFLHERHIEITVFSDIFSGWLRAFRSILSPLIGVAYVGALFYGSVQMAMNSLAGGERTGTGWDVPMPQIIKVVLVVALAVFMLLIIRSLIRSLVAIATGQPAVASHFSTHTQCGEVNE